MNDMDKKSDITPEDLLKGVNEEHEPISDAEFLSNLN